MTVIDFLDLQQQRLDAEELKDEAQEWQALSKKAGRGSARTSTSALTHHLLETVGSAA